MSHEFNDAEMAYCDICGDFVPYETMFELEDSRIVCEDCMDEIETEEDE